MSLSAFRVSFFLSMLLFLSGGAQAQDPELLEKARDNDLHAVLRLLEQGVDINTRGGRKWTALHHAADGGFDALTEQLIKRGADPNLAAEGGATPLHRASARGHLKVVKHLLAGGARVNAVNLDGKTPLHLAALYGHTRTARLLIKAGAKVNALDNAGQTPLEEASSRIKAGMRGTYDLLLKHGGMGGEQVRKLNIGNKRRKGLLPKCRGFQDATWGMTNREVADMYPDVIPLRGDRDLALPTRVADLEAKVFFHFPGGRLQSAVVVFGEEYNQTDQYVSDYRRLHKLLTRKYGKPESVNKVWKNDRYKLSSRLGDAVAHGHLTLQTTWETDKTTIMLSCFGEGNRPRVTLAYKSVKKTFGIDNPADRRALDDL
jgi:hypothetical protein